VKFAETRDQQSLPPQSESTSSCPKGSEDSPHVDIPLYSLCELFRPATDALFPGCQNTRPTSIVRVAIQLVSCHSLRRSMSF
jgi:hypothetical protein